MPRRSIALGSRGQRKHGAPSQSPRPNPGPGTRRAPMSQLVASIAGLARDLGLSGEAHEGRELDGLTQDEVAALV